MPKAQVATEEPAAALNTQVVDKKLEETIEAEPVAEIAPSTNGATEIKPEAEEAPVAPKVEEAPTPEVAAKEAEEETKEPEKPKEPVPSPAVTRTQSTTKPAPAPAHPAAPPKPLSWASRAAAAVGSTPKPAVPVVAPKTATPPAQPRAAAPAQAAKSAPAPTSAPAHPAAEKDKDNSGWQTAGSDNVKRQNRPQSISGPLEKEGTMGYVRNVTEKVDAQELKEALASFGKLIYFDVNRSKARFCIPISTPYPSNIALELCLRRVRNR